MQQSTFAGCSKNTRACCKKVHDRRVDATTRKFELFDATQPSWIQQPATYSQYRNASTHPSEWSGPLPVRPNALFSRCAKLHLRIISSLFHPSRSGEKTCLNRQRRSPIQKKHTEQIFRNTTVTRSTGGFGTLSTKMKPYKIKRHTPKKINTAARWTTLRAMHPESRAWQGSRSYLPPRRFPCRRSWRRQ